MIWSGPRPGGGSAPAPLQPTPTPSQCLVPLHSSPATPLAAFGGRRLGTSAFDSEQVLWPGQQPPLARTLSLALSGGVSIWPGPPPPAGVTAIDRPMHWQWSTDQDQRLMTRILIGNRIRVTAGPELEPES